MITRFRPALVEPHMWPYVYCMAVIWAITSVGFGVFALWLMGP